jgi:hypothetical protein
LSPGKLVKKKEEQKKKEKTKYPLLFGKRQWRPRGQKMQN